MNQIRLVVGADNAGVHLKDILTDMLSSHRRIAAITDVGVANAADDTAYPMIAIRAAEMVAAGEVDRGLLVCGTGIGMAISANKVPGVRATTAHDCYSAERAVLSNDAAVLALGARVVGPELAKRIVLEWLGHEFDAHSPSAAKLAHLAQYEQTHHSGPSTREDQAIYSRI